MTRQVTDHIIEGADSHLSITVLDEPGPGGANHAYEISQISDSRVLCKIDFQKGPLQEVGLNGITQEALIAVCMDRLRSFQAGPFSCEPNQIALEHLELALAYLQKRTRDRLARGVEGRNLH